MRMRDSAVFGLWRMCLPPRLVRPGRRGGTGGATSSRPGRCGLTGDYDTRNVRCVPYENSTTLLTAVASGWEKLSRGQFFALKDCSQ